MNLRWMGVLLALWALVFSIFGVVVVNQLNAFRSSVFPLVFWFAQQGQEKGRLSNFKSSLVAICNFLRY